MSQTELLLKKVEGLPPDYMAQIFDFIDRLKYKASLSQTDPAQNPYKAIEELEGFGLALGSKLTVERFLQMRREYTELEEAQYRRLFRHEGK
jgi:hypothetical protein